MEWLDQPWTVTPWQMLMAIGVLLAAWAMLPRWSGETRGRLESAQDRLGLPDQSPGLFFLAAVLWTALTSLLAAGLAWLIWDVASYPMTMDDPTGPGDRQEVWNFRFRIAQMVALTTVLGAVIALPLTLIQVNLKRQANRTADEALFNQKITEAAADLHARRQKTMLGIDRKFDAWEDDVARRNAAIDRLEGLVQEQMRSQVEDDIKRDLLRRVSRLLGIYVRELSAELKPVPVPKYASREELRQWARSLTARPDLENAVRTLGRMRSLAGGLRDDVVIDLESANLQGCRLQDLDFDEGKQKSNFSRVQMQGANLIRARMQGADLGGAQMQGAVLHWTQMQGADLGGAQMQGAVLHWAQMQGADLQRAQMQGADLRGAQMQGAVLHGAQMQGANLRRAQMQGAVLREAQMQGTGLFEAQMQGTGLHGAQMQGAILGGTRMDDTTDLTAATLRGAAVKSVDDTTIAKLAPFREEIFADGTVTVPEGQRPEHWAEEELVFFKFDEEWHRVMREHFKMDPENPE